MEFKKNKLVTLLVFAVASHLSVANAQAKLEDNLTTFPGSMWSVVGNANPMEKGNVISSTYLEQGINLSNKDSVSVLPYFSLSPTFDTKGYDWNNRLLSNVGIKAVKNFDNGIVSVTAGYANEFRIKSGLSESAPIVRADTWFGWKGEGGKYPGTVWGVVGTISPVEKGNVIGVVRVEQGVLLHKFDNGLSLIPFVEATLARDSKKYDWNNRQILGVGLKVSNPDPSCGCEINLIYQDEHRKSGSSAKSVALIAKFWFGWKPSK